MTLGEFRKLTENLSDELELKHWNDEWSTWESITSARHTNKYIYPEDCVLPQFIVGLE